MRDVGIGYSSLERLGGYLNVPAPLQVISFNINQKGLSELFGNITKESMKEASQGCIENEFVELDE